MCSYCESLIQKTIARKLETVDCFVDREKTVCLEKAIAIKTFLNN